MMFSLRSLFGLFRRQPAPGDTRAVSVQYGDRLIYRGEVFLCSEDSPRPGWYGIRMSEYSSAYIIDWTKNDSCTFETAEAACSAAGAAYADLCYLLTV